MYLQGGSGAEKFPREILAGLVVVSLHAYGEGYLNINLRINLCHNLKTNLQLLVVTHADSFKRIMTVTGVM